MTAVLQSENESLRNLIAHYEAEEVVRIKRTFSFVTNRELENLYEIDPILFNNLLNRMVKAKSKL